MSNKEMLELLPDETEIKKTEKKEPMKNYLNKFELGLGIGLALYVVIFLWGFFTQGSLAMGINATIFYLLFFVYFFLGIENKKEYILKNMYFLIPFFLITLSFSLYENPYLKTINIFVFPILIICFIGISLTKFSKSNHWGLGLFFEMIIRGLPIEQTFSYFGHEKKRLGTTTLLFKKIATGLGVLLGLNIVILILLTSADPKFAEIISNILPGINFSLILKLVVALISLIIFFSLKVRWKDEEAFDQEEKTKKIDIVIASIILLGTLGVYLLFIGVQIDTLFGNESLSKNLEVVSYSAKSGFWQLFAVSVINLVLFYVFFTKKYVSIKVYLGVFLSASFIILLSAGTRMFNYVSEFGLSYEKFTASYTLCFFGILFICLFALLFTKGKEDILKFGIILTLCMYSFLNILPMEKIIFNFNLGVASQENAQIDPYNSHMLSSDIYSDVLKSKESHADIFNRQGWEEWIEKKNHINQNKKWFEKNISNF